MPMAEGGPIGMRLRRLEDGRLLCGDGRFVDDLTPAGALHVAFLRSPLASGRVTGLDTSAAEAAPGVRAVFTAAALHGSCSPLAVPRPPPGRPSPGPPPPPPAPPPPLRPHMPPAPPPTPTPP